MGVEEGRITVDVDVTHGRVAGVRVASSRRVDACQVLVGKTVDDAVRAVPLLFTVCARAQTVAALQACESALGVDVGDSFRRARGLWVAGEALDNHAWQVALEWPRLWGGAPSVEGLRAVREATRAVGLGSGLTLPMRIGPAACAPATDLNARLGALDAALHALCGPPLPDSLTDLDAWMRGQSVAARALTQLVDGGLADVGRCDSALLPPLDAAWFRDQADADPHFEAAPTFRGAPAETGALARHAATPLLQALLGQHGNGLLTRWVARLVDMETLAKNVRRVAAGQTQIPPGARGAAVVETSRGTLAHAVRVDGERVSGWRVVAPTEWNFHPDGPLVRGLVGTAAQDLHKRVALVVAGLDPCVAFDVHIHGD